MSFLPIFYYGVPGLEADIFQSYMRCSGYPVKMMLPNGSPLAPLPDDTASVVVIALPKSSEELVRLARALRIQSKGSLKHIFILADGQPLQVDDPTVEIIERPFRLSEVIKRIQVYSRQV